MAPCTHPPKELVREVMAKHRQEKSPPMSPEQARRELGWEMLRDDRSKNL